MAGPIERQQKRALVKKKKDETTNQYVKRRRSLSGRQEESSERKRIEGEKMTGKSISGKPVSNYEAEQNKRAVGTSKQIISEEVQASQDKKEQEEINELARKKVLQENMEATYREQDLREQMTPEQEEFTEKEPEESQIPILSETPLTNDFMAGLSERSVANQIASLPLAQAYMANVKLTNLGKDEDYSKFVGIITDNMIRSGKRPEEMTDSPELQSTLSLELNERDIKTLKSGEAKVTKLAGLIEALPLSEIKFLDIGPTIEGVVAGVTGTTLPSESINSIMGQVRDLNAQFRDDGTMSTYNPNSKLTYLDQVKETEELVLDLQSKLKLISLQSTRYQAEPEEIRGLMSEINTVLGKAEKTKAQIIFG